jgi:hypothetical protein
LNREIIFAFFWGIINESVFLSGICGTIPYAPEEPARAFTLVPDLNGTVGSIMPIGRYTSITRPCAIPLDEVEPVDAGLFGRCSVYGLQAAAYNHAGSGTGICPVCYEKLVGIRWIYDRSCCG